jgi:hypothetical protein
MSGVAAGFGISSHQLLKQALLAAKEEAAGYDDPEVPLLSTEDESSSGYDDPDAPFLSPHSCCYNSLSSSELVNRCAVCSTRRQRGRIAWVLLLMWIVPLALAAACWRGGPTDPRSNLQHPDGRLLMVQVRLLGLAAHPCHVISVYVAATEHERRSCRQLGTSAVLKHVSACLGIQMDPSLRPHVSVWGWTPQQNSTSITNTCLSRNL